MFFSALSVLVPVILTTQYVGAKNYQKLQEVIVTSLFLNFIFSLLLAFLYFVFWIDIFSFMRLPKELIPLGKNYFLVMSSFCSFQALTLTTGTILKNYGKPKLMLVVNILVNAFNILGKGSFLLAMLLSFFVFLIALPFSYFGIYLGGGLVGIWITNALDEWIRGFAVLSRWKQQKWRTKSFIS